MTKQKKTFGKHNPRLVKTFQPINGKLAKIEQSIREGVPTEVFVVESWKSRLEFSTAEAAQLKQYLESYLWQCALREMA